MKGGEVVFEFKGDTKDLEKKATSIGDIIKGSLGAKVIAKGVQAITNSLDGAISRVDTLNQFPKVMQLFGVSTDEANKSIKRIDKSVQGLPTSLNDAVAGVQDIFTVTKNLPQAEKMFKAVNDSAMVFASGSEDASKRFIYAYKQALSAGKVQAQDFNQMNEAIPGLMSKVAEAMGVTQAELKQGLSDGTISMDQFNDALLELDTKGTGSMKSLESSAKTSTGGIRTSLTNLKTAITRGVANSIQTMNEALKSNGLPDFQGMVEITKNVVNNAFKIIGKVIGDVVPVIANLIKVIKPLAPLIGAVALAWAGWKIGSKVQGLVKAVQEAKLQLSLYTLEVGKAKFADGALNGDLNGLEVIYGLLTGKITLAQLATSAFSKAQSILNAVMNANPIGLIITGIVLLIGGLVLLYAKCEGFRNFVNGAISSIGAFLSGAVQSVVTFFTQTIPNAINTLVGIIPQIPYYVGYAIGWIAGKLVEFVTQTIPNFIVSVINWIASLPGRIWGVITQIPGLFISMLNTAKTYAWNGIKNVANTILNTLRSLPGQVVNIGRNIAQGLVNGITSLIGKIKSVVTNIANGIKDGFKKALKIGSPSKVFYDYGAYTDEGYMNGLDSMKKKINTELNNMVEMSPQMTQTASQTFRPQTNVNVYNSFKQDPLGQMVNEIKTFSGGAKNDYNYGMGV